MSTQTDLDFSQREVGLKFALSLIDQRQTEAEDLVNYSETIARYLFLGELPTTDD